MASTVLFLAELDEELAKFGAFLESNVHDLKSTCLRVGVANDGLRLYRLILSLKPQFDESPRMKELLETATPPPRVSSGTSI